VLGADWADTYDSFEEAKGAVTEFFSKHNRKIERMTVRISYISTLFGEE